MWLPSNHLITMNKLKELSLDLENLDTETLEALEDFITSILNIRSNQVYSVVEIKVNHFYREEDSDESCLILDINDNKSFTALFFNHNDIKSYLPYQDTVTFSHHRLYSWEEITKTSEIQYICEELIDILREAAYEEERNLLIQQENLEELLSLTSLVRNIMP